MTLGACDLVRRQRSARKRIEVDNEGDPGRLHLAHFHRHSAARSLNSGVDRPLRKDVALEVFGVRVKQSRLDCRQQCWQLISSPTGY